ncbi:MAG: hypothetical protein PSX37_12410, partial [bacterium]|nr:hypothetical protein [bacterium]
MKVNEPYTEELASGRRRTHSKTEFDQPIRAELFSVERLEEHGRSLAVAQTVTAAPHRGLDVHSRIADNGRV